MSSLTKLFTIPASHCSALYHGVSVIIPNTSPTTINRAHYIFGLSIILLTNLYEIFFHHVSSNGYPLLERPYWYSMDLLWMSKVLNGLAILAILTIAMKKKARLFYINSINVGDNRKKSAIRRQNGETSTCVGRKMKEYSSYLNQIFPAVMALNWAYNTASYWENVFLTSQTPLELTCKIVWIAALLLQEFYCLFAFYGPLYYYLNLFQVITIQQYSLTRRIEDIETSRRMYRRDVKLYVGKIHHLTRQSDKLMNILSDPTFYAIILGTSFFSYFFINYLLILCNLLMHHTERDCKMSVHFIWLTMFNTFLAIYLLRTFFALIREGINIDKKVKEFRQLLL